MKGPEIRMDDVLQVSGITEHQRKEMGAKSLYELFLEADKVLEYYRYPCTLAICAEGIDA